MIGKLVSLSGMRPGFLTLEECLPPPPLNGGYVLAVFEDRASPGAVEVVSSTRLDLALYKEFTRPTLTEPVR